MTQYQDPRAARNPQAPRNPQGAQPSQFPRNPQGDAMNPNLNFPRGYAPQPAPTQFAPRPAPAPQGAPAAATAPQVSPAPLAPMMPPAPLNAPAPAPVLNLVGAALPSASLHIDYPTEPGVPPIGVIECASKAEADALVKGQRYNPLDTRKPLQRGNRAACFDWPATLAEAKALAHDLSFSGFVPACIRSTATVDHTADVFIVLAKAQSLGLSFAEAFSAIYILPSKSGDLRMGMYVRTKEGLCKPYGRWTVDVNPSTGDTMAKGMRYETGEERSIVYSAYEAAQRGVLGHDKNGQIIGIGNWAGKWMDMMRARATGRLLDALFPDIIGGFITKEELDDEAYYQELHQRKVRDAARDVESTPADEPTTAPSKAPVSALEAPQSVIASEDEAKAILAQATAKTRRSRKAVAAAPRVATPAESDVVSIPDTEDASGGLQFGTPASAAEVAAPAPVASAITTNGAPLSPEAQLHAAVTGTVVDDPDAPSAQSAPAATNPNPFDLN